MRTALAVTIAGLAIAAFPARAARANGAFPAVEGVLVPADRPKLFMLVTNFGVVLSEDGGQTWSWSCEQEANAFGVLHQFGPAPRRRLFAVAGDRVVTSDDATCGWQIAGGLLADQQVTDVFPDPTNADRVLAIGAANGAWSVFESADGGGTFGAKIYQASSGDVVTSVEIARADPRVVYVATFGADQSPKLARTNDGGAHWTVNDLSAGVGPGFPRIIAVDPDDADTVILRWASVTGGEAIVVTRDGSVTATATLSIPLYFTSFARMPDGALVVSAVVAVSPVQRAALFVSHDGGASFQRNDAVPGILALAQRNGILYAATDNFGDGYALGASADEGATWQPVMRFDQIGSIMACLRTNAQCQAACRALAGTGLGSPGVIWDQAVCSAGEQQGGTGGTGGVTGSARGGGCSLGPARPPANRGAALLAAAMIAFGLSARRSRPRASPPAGARRGC
jgi:hypothetical protein